MSGESESSSFFSLPKEMIEYILCSNILSDSDLLNFSLTCKAFKWVLDCPIIAKEKLLLRYPQLVGVFEESLEEPIDWLKRRQYMISLRNKIYSMIQEMPTNYHSKESLDNDDVHRAFMSLALEESYSLYCATLILYEINDRSDEMVVTPHDQLEPLTGPYSFTCKYYAVSMLEYLKLPALKFELYDLVNLSDVMTSEVIANFFDRYLDSSFEFPLSFVESRLNHLAEQVTLKFPPMDAVRHVSKELKQEWISKELTENYWDHQTCLNIMSAISEVLHFYYDKLGNDSTYVIMSKILPPIGSKKGRNGAPVVMYVIYEAIARRCGVRCEVITFHNHEMITWRSSYTLNSPQYLVDIISGMARPGRCPYNEGPPPRPMNTAVNLITFLGFKILSAQYDHVNRNRYVVNAEQLVKLANKKIPEYSGQRSNIKCLTPNERDIIKEQLAAPYVFKFGTSTRDRSNPSIRPPNLKYAIGMVCYHSVFRYRCVLCDWDPTCNASDEWEDRLESLELGTDQPFYTVVAEDQSERYVAQESLLPITLMYERQRLPSVELSIARYFSHFNSYFYVPNAEKNKEYPYDAEARLNFMRTL